MTDNIERKCVKYENLSLKFSDQSPDYTQQFCNIYRVRLKEMEKILLELVALKWSSYPVCKLHNLSQTQYDKCVVIGTIFKDQKLKPSVLKQLAEGHQLTPQPILTSFTDESDRLFLEDELQRYELLGSLDGKKLITGVTLALLGTNIGGAQFQVDDYIFCGYKNQIERPLPKEDTYLIFLSGLDFVKHAHHLPNLELFMHRISGVLGDIDNVSKIARIIIAGNSVRTVQVKHQASISMTRRIATTLDTFDAVKAFDTFLSCLCQSIDIDVMAGENDPSNYMLPQKQMHHCMFPESAVYKTVNFVTNPYYCSLDGVKIIGSSGQPVRDIMWFSEIKDPLEAMEKCLEWNHLAPTCPDTLGCYPYYNKDPFIFEECPHIFFAGNQPQFGTKFARGDNGQQVLLISIPEFSNSFEAVFVNLKDLECSTVVFDVCK